MKKFSLIFTISTLFLYACVSLLTANTIRVYDENAYVRAKKMLQYDFQQQKIDNELLPSTQALANLNPVFMMNGRTVAKNLYDRLSISFRFGISDRAEAKKMLLEQYVNEHAKIEMHAYGFTIEQGTERITATVLGELDWDNNDIMDYIVSFRINQKAITYTSNEEENHMEMPTRDYTLLIKDIHAPIYVGEILFIHDYVKQSAGIRSAVYRDYATAQEGFFQDHVSTSFEQGDENIVQAPSQNTHKQDTNEDGASVVRLSE